MLPKTSEECRAEALAEEQMAEIVSYLPDKDRCRANAKYWRGMEQAALYREADKPSGP